MALYHTKTADAELAGPGEVAFGATGIAVKRVQEWCCLHGHYTRVDADFGSATKAVVEEFQASQGLPVTGRVDAVTWEWLVDPLARALALATAGPGDLQAGIVLYATQHLSERPREVGSPNAGPWVRVYMDGNEGAEWLWCAGFVTFAIAQASRSTGQASPIRRTFSCDELAAQALASGRLVRGASVSEVRARVRPGDLFLVVSPDNPADRTHTGIVIGVGDGVVQTIEGNTNDEGTREGYEVCRRTRASAKLEFVVL